MCELKAGLVHSGSVDGSLDELRRLDEVVSVVSVRGEVEPADSGPLYVATNE